MSKKDNKSGNSGNNSGSNNGKNVNNHQIGDKKAEELRKGSEIPPRTPKPKK